MGNKNNRGGKEAPRAATVYAEKKLAEKQLAEKKQAEKLALEKEKAEEFVKNRIPPHDSIAIEQVGDSMNLVIDLDLINKGFIVDMPSLLETLPMYAPFIGDVTIRLYAPAKYRSRAIYSNLIAKMNQMVDVLNQFELNKLDVIIGLNSDDFLQMKLAAFVHGIKFKKWTMSYHIFDQQGETSFTANVKRGSSYGRRLYGVYKAEFQTQKGVISGQL